MPAAKKKRKPHRKRSYSDQQKAAALVAVDANGGNVLKTSKQLAIPNPTLGQWNNGQFLHPDVLKIKEAKKGLLADAIEDLAWTLVSSLPSKIEGAPLVAATTALAIAIDKMQLLRGKATNISGKEELSDDERLEQLKGLVERARQRRLGLSDEGRAEAVQVVNAPAASMGTISGETAGTGLLQQS